MAREPRLSHVGVGLREDEESMEGEGAAQSSGRARVALATRQVHAHVGLALWMSRRGGEHERRGAHTLSEAGAVRGRPELGVARSCNDPNLKTMF